MLLRGTREKPTDRLPAEAGRNFFLFLNIIRAVITLLDTFVGQRPAENTMKVVNGTFPFRVLFPLVIFSNSLLVD
jgi:hypothetical protein